MIHCFYLEYFYHVNRSISIVMVDCLNLHTLMGTSTVSSLKSYIIASLCPFFGLFFILDLFWLESMLTLFAESFNRTSHTVLHSVGRHYPNKPLDYYNNIIIHLHILGSIYLFVFKISTSLTFWTGKWFCFLQKQMNRIPYSYLTTTNQKKYTYTHDVVLRKEST